MSRSRKHDAEAADREYVTRLALFFQRHPQQQFTGNEIAGIILQTSQAHETGKREIRRLEAMMSRTYVS